MSKDYIIANDNYAKHREYLVFEKDSVLCKNGDQFVGSNEPAIIKFIANVLEPISGVSLKPFTAQKCRITPTKTGFTFRLIGKPFDIE